MSCFPQNVRVDSLYPLICQSPDLRQYRSVGDFSWQSKHRNVSKHINPLFSDNNARSIALTVVQCHKLKDDKV
jgi:hypothetical protein